MCNWTCADYAHWVIASGSIMGLCRAYNHLYHESVAQSYFARCISLWNLFSKPLDYSFLRVFGCEWFLNFLAKPSNKLTHRSPMCVLLIMLWVTKVIIVMNPSQVVSMWVEMLNSMSPFFHIELLCRLVLRHWRPLAIRTNHFFTYLGY